MLFNIFLKAEKQRVGCEVANFTEDTSLFRGRNLKASGGKIHKYLLKRNDWTTEVKLKKCKIRKK